MSFLSILLVASAFYFAQAIPDSQSGSEASSGAQVNDGGVKPAPEIPGYSVPVTDPSDYHHKMFGFMQDVEKAMDQYMTPMMSKLNVKKQDELKSMDANGFASYVNNLFGRQ